MSFYRSLFFFTLFHYKQTHPKNCVSNKVLVAARRINLVFIKKRMKINSKLLHHHLYQLTLHYTLNAKLFTFIYKISIG